MKQQIKNNKFLVKILMCICRIFRYNKFKIKGKNTVKIEGVQKRGNVCIKGNNNSLIIKNPQCNMDFTCLILGNNNKILVEDGCILKNLYICIEEDNNEIIINKDTMICGKTEMYCLEGSKINIGESCLFSSNVYFTTSDRHSILDIDGKRINKPGDIIVKDHVWLGYGSTLLKGVMVEEHNIVGTHSVITKSIMKKGCVVAGNPAKIVKENINWDNTRFPISNANGQ